MVRTGGELDPMCGAEAATVVIVAYCGDRWLGECLGSLTRASRRPMRVVLVDNGGNERLRDLPLGKFEHVVLKTASPLGFAEANNFALREAGVETEAVCFLNQDTRSGAGWLDACLACLESEPELGAVSPLLRTYDGLEWDGGFRDCMRRSGACEWGLERGRELEAWYEVPAVTAAAMVVRTEALRVAGPFDPIFGSYYEDYDLCRRLRLAGYRMGVCTEGEVRHFSGSSTTSEAARRRRMRQVIRNRALLRFREAESGRLGAVLRYAAGTFAYNLGRGVLGTASSQPPGVQLAAHWDLLRSLGRVVSRRRDERAWKRYLRELGWPAVERDASAGAEL